MATKLSQSTPLLKIISIYLDFYSSKNGHTLRAKKIDLDDFVNFLFKYKAYSKVNKLKISDWSKESVQRFIDDLEKNKSRSTLARRYATLKHMAKTFSKQIVNFEDPTQKIKLPKKDNYKPKKLSEEERKQIIKKASGRIQEKNSFIRVRNHAILNLILETGIRVEELRSLQYKQLDQEVSWLKTIKSKNKKYRNVQISKRLQKILRNYLKIRKEKLNSYIKKIDKKTSLQLPLFISFYNAKLDDIDSFKVGHKTIWRAINEFSTKTKLHPHLLRDNFGLKIAKKSPVNKTSDILGYTSSKIAKKYY